MNVLHPWMLAARPRTMILSVLPVIVASAMAYHEGFFRLWPMLNCLAFALTAQITANWANDYFDFVKGADNAQRKGPIRVVASGLISPKSMLAAAALMGLISLIIGLSVLQWTGLWILPLGLAALACSFLYSAGPYPLGWNGLGDVCVILFFGLFAVGASYYAQSGHISIACMLIGLAVGLVANNVLIAAYTRDIESDRAINKRTLGVLFGRKFAQALYSYSGYVALFIPVILMAMGWSVAVGLPILIIPYFWHLERKMLFAQTLPQWIGALKGSIHFALCYGALLSLGLALH